MLNVSSYMLFSHQNLALAGSKFNTMGASAEDPEPAADDGGTGLSGILLAPLSMLGKKSLLRWLMSSEPILEGNANLLRLTRGGGGSDENACGMGG